MLKKISVNKSDKAALIVEKIIETEANEVVLVIPRFSHITESLEYFNLLKREADAIGKKLLIESVDNKVIELAELAGIEAINPFFVKNKKQFSDIIPKKGKTISVKNKAPSEEKKEIPADNWDKKEEDYLDKLYDAKYRPKESDVSHNEIKTEVKNEVLKKERQPEITEEEKESFIKRLPIKTFLALIVLGVAVYGAITILPKADLKIVTKKINWTYNDSIITQTSAKIDLATLTIPNQKFFSNKDTIMTFPATGKKQVSNKATGKITVYNGYSSEPQPLVQNTRFMSPDGKIFLLTKKIIVPGAKISEGKIIPSSIDTDVIAEKAGEDYNIGPVKLFTIPGFKGGPKYSAFYGESNDSMAGGFIGEIAYPTPADIADASQKIKDTLQSSLKETINSQISEEFKIVDGASVFSISDLKINNDVDKNSNFSVSAKSQMTIIAFKESDLVDVLTQKAESENKDLYQVKSHDLQYGVARTDTVSGRMSFPVTFNAVLSYKIDVNQLKKEIVGKSNVELKKAIFSLPGLDTANVSLWPFWVQTVPNNPAKINVAVD